MIEREAENQKDLEYAQQWEELKREWRDFAEDTEILFSGDATNFRDNISIVNLRQLARLGITPETKTFTVQDYSLVEEFFNLVGAKEYRSSPAPSTVIRWFKNSMGDEWIYHPLPSGIFQPGRQWDYIIKKL